MNKSVIIIMLAAFFLVPGIAAADFTDHGNETVTDTATNLMWQKRDDGAVRLWEATIKYCEGLSLGGFTDWRLPNIKELRSIVDSTKTAPMINSTFFPSTKSSVY